MAEPISITSEPPLNKGLDYAFLKEEGTRLVQQLAGNIWTDYNEHDPGVTTLEQVCYALTELSYRAEFPLEDLLIPRPGGRINPRRHALFIPKRVLPCNPATKNDYRKLLVDRVPDLANVWLTEFCPKDSLEPVNGLYEIWLSVPGIEADCDSEDVEKITQRALRVYSRHRNLCEDVHSIRILEPIRTIVSATVSISEVATPEAILAGLFFNIGNFIAPELRRESLKSLVERGATADQIFNGPLLKNGFISDNQLQPKAAQVTVQEIIRVMARSAGVTSVRNVSVEADRRFSRGTGEIINIPERRILQLDTRPNEEGSFTIRLFKNGIEYRPKPARVQRELNKLWTSYRRTYNLALQYNEFFAVPEGRYRDVERYYSIQNQYPNVYGINCYGLPAGAPTARQAQAKQFKGYLMVFDQLLADFFAQLDHTRELYSIKYGLRNTYFYQYLEKSVPDVEPLLKNNYRSGLRRIVHGEDSFVERRNRFLDFLLALYAEQLDAASIADLNLKEQEDQDTSERLMIAKLELLHYLVASTHNRGRGFDYLASPSSRNIAGMVIKSRIQLGMPVTEHAMIDLLDESGMEVVDSDRESSIGRPLTRHRDYIEESFIPIRSLSDEPETTDDPDTQSKQPIQVLGSQRLSEDFLRAASNLDNFRVGSLPGEDAAVLVCKGPSDDEWRLVGKYPDARTAVRAARQISATIQNLNHRSRQLYIVEHTLLRFSRWTKNDAEDAEEYTDDSNRPQADFCYSFTITAVVSMSQSVRADPDYRRFVKQVIRENAPAHLVVDYCFLTPFGLRDFEALYWAWRRALRNRELREIRKQSARLQAFLERESSKGAK